MCEHVQSEAEREKGKGYIIEKITCKMAVDKYIDHIPHAVDGKLRTNLVLFPK